MAKRTVAKNRGMCPMGAIHGRDPIAGNGTPATVVSLLAKGLSPVITDIMVQPKPTSMNVVATAENGTNSLSVRMMPSGRSGKARLRIQSRMGKCHSEGVWFSVT